MVKVVFVNCWEVIMEETELTKPRRTTIGMKYVKALLDNGLLEKVMITDEKELDQLRKLEIQEQPLPSGVYVTYEDNIRSYCRLKDVSSDMSSEDINRLLLMRQTKHIKKISEDIHTIRNWVIFFGVLAVIGLVGGFIVALT